MKTGAAERRRRRHFVRAAAADPSWSARRRRRPKSPDAPPPLTSIIPSVPIQIEQIVNKVMLHGKRSIAEKIGCAAETPSIIVSMVRARAPFTEYRISP